MRAADAFAATHPQKKGIVTICQQGMEGNIGLMKICNGDHGNGHLQFIPLMVKYADMYVLAGLKYNQHDLRLLSRQHRRNKLLIYDGNRTDEVLTTLETAMPELALDFLDLLDEIEFGKIETISARILSVFTSHVEWKDQCKIISQDVNENVLLEMIDESENVANYKKIFNKTHEIKPLTRREMLQEISSLKVNVNGRFGASNNEDDNNNDNNDNENDNEDKE